MFEDIDRFRAGWAVVGLALVAILAYVTVAFLGTVVFGLFLYYATRPFHRRIRQYVGQRTVAAMLALLALALPLVLLVAYTAAIAVQELANVAKRVDLGPYSSVIEPYLDVSTVVDNPRVALDELGDPQAILDVLSSTLGYLGVIGSGVLSLFIAFAIAFYLLRDSKRLSGYGALLSDERGVLVAYGRAVDRSLSDVFFGNILNALLTGVIGALAYSVLNLAAPEAFSIPYPALIGVLAGAGSLIPVVGMKIVYVPLVLYLGGRAAMTGVGWEFVALVAGVSLVLVDLIPDIVLRPYVSGRGLHTGTVMFAYILGPILFGWYGLFLGPLILVLIVHFVRLVLPELVDGSRIEASEVAPENLAEYNGVVPDGSTTESSEETDSPAEATATDGAPDDDTETDG